MERVDDCNKAGKLVSWEKLTLAKVIKTMLQMSEQRLIFLNRIKPIS